MADQRSVICLAFYFGKRIFAYKRFAQGLRRSVSALWSFMREKLDQIVKVKQKAFAQQVWKTRKVFFFGVCQVDFPRRTIWPEEFSLQARKVLKFFGKLRFHKIEIGTTAFTGNFCNSAEITFPGWLKHSVPSLSCWKQKRQSPTHRNLTKQFIQ